MSSGLLAGLRVVETSEYIAGPFAARLLADLGADVIKVEPPGGDPARLAGPFPGDVPHPEKSGLFLALNTGKRSIVLDPASAADREQLRTLVRDADVVIEGGGAMAAQHRWLARGELRAANSGLTVTSITPFGLSGPYRDFKASDLVIFQMSGYAPVVAGNVQDQEREPPLRAGGNQAEFVAGLTAATATMLALSLKHLTGAGHDVDVSALEAMLMLPQSAFAEASLAGGPRPRAGRGTSGAVVAIYPTSDGYIAVSAREEHQWQAWLDIQGRPSWWDDERFNTRAARQQNWSQLEPLLFAWTLTQKKQELYRLCQAARVPAFPVNTANDLLNSEHLKARGFFQELEHPVAGKLPYTGFPCKISTGEILIESPAPLLGAGLPRWQESSQRRVSTPVPAASNAPAKAPRLPMEGVRVLDFSWIIAGPTCSRFMGMMGAEIIKVESRRRPDSSRNGPSHLFLNQAKRSLTLNVSTPRGLEIARSLSAHCDVVMENFATGVIERMGLGYEELKQRNPGLILLSSAGLGHTGPDRDHVAYGTLLQCFTGWSGQTGRPGEKPLIGGVWGDPLTGMLQTFAILCALRQRNLTGEGMYIDVSMAEAICNTLPEAFMDYAMNGRILGPNGNRDRRFTPHNLYRCAGDDAWAAIAVTNEDEWRELCARIGQPALAGDTRFATPDARHQHEDALDAIIGSWTASLSPAEVMQRLQPAVPSGPSYSPFELLSEPHLLQREFFRELPADEGKTVRQPGVPWHIAGSGEPRALPPPELGADSRDILRDLLGIPDSELDELEREQVLY